MKLSLPAVPVTSTGTCSAHSVLFPRWHEEAAALRLGRDLAKALEALSRPTTKERGDRDGS